MLIITIVRWAIFITFLVVMVEGIAGMILVPRFYVRYVAKHLELEKRVEALERRVKILESL
jgi:hypothetical protein